MNILVTGASRGIGFQTVYHLSKNSANHIFAIARNKPNLEELENQCKRFGHSNVKIFPFDLENDDLGDLFQIVQSEFKQVDGLVNNAGGLLRKLFEDITAREAKRVFEINFFKPAQLIRTFLPLLQKSKRAHVVNISSMAGFQGSSKFPGLNYYGASKAAIASLTESLAAEFKDSGMCFNALSLGAVSTEMLAEAFPGFNAPVTAKQMGEFIGNFVLTGQNVFNGQVIPVNLSNM